MLIAPADDFPDRFLRVDVRVALIDVANFHGLSNVEASPIGLLFSHDHAEQRRLARSVGTDDPYDARWRQVEIEVFNQQSLTKSFLQLGGLDDRIAQARSVGDGDGQTGFLFVGALGQHLFVVVDAGFVLGASPLGGLAHPVQLAFQFLAALGFLLFLLGKALRLLLQPRGVIALVRNALAAVQFQNPLGHVIEEVAVVRHTQHGARILLKVLFQPVNRLRIQVVGRLIQQQHVRLLKQQAAQRNAAALTP